MKINDYQNLINLNDYRKQKRKTLTADNSTATITAGLSGNYTVAENIKRINALLEKLGYKYGVKPNIQKDLDK